MQHIVLTTPSGRIGRHVLTELASEPTVSLTLIERNANRLPSTIRERAQVIEGAIQDVGVLEKALSGADALFWCTPPPSGQEPSIQAYYQTMARLVAERVAVSSVQRIVTVSSGGKGIARNAGYISALHQMEEILNQTGRAVRHLRTASHMENYLNQVVPIARRNRFALPLDGDFKIPLVAAKDIAAAAVYWLRYVDWTEQKGVAVQGPEDLSPNQIAAKFSAALHQEVAFESISIEQFTHNILAHTGNNDLATNLANMYREIAAGLYNAEARTPETTTPTTFDRWIEETFKPRWEAASAAA